MSESFRNTNPSAYTTPAIQPAAGNTPVSGTTVAQPTQAATTVDMTNTEQVATATQKGEETKQSHLDIGEDYTLSTSYIQKYMSPANNTTQDKTYGDDNDIIYNFGNFGDQKLLVDSFKRKFLHEQSERDGYTNAKQLFARLDNQNYIYGRVYFQGSWINTRTPIDEKGNATGLPEMLPA